MRYKTLDPVDDPLFEHSSLSSSFMSGRESPGDRVELGRKEMLRTARAYYGRSSTWEGTGEDDVGLLGDSNWRQNGKSKGRSDTKGGSATPSWTADSCVCLETTSVIFETET